MIDRKLFYTVFFIVVMVMFVSFADAGIADWFNKITGRVTDFDVNASVTVTGINPIRIAVFNGTLPTETVANDGNGTFTFNMHLTDSDGTADINVSATTANFTRAGEQVRENLSCSQIGTALNSTTINVSCTIEMWWFDENGAWDISVSANDLGNLTPQYNTSFTFTLPQLSGLELSPTSITFTSVAPGADNTTSNNDPVTINNTGNRETNLSINGRDLSGDTTSTVLLPIANMTASNGTGSNLECNTRVGSIANATVLTNGTAVDIGSSNLTRGNHTIDDGTAQEELYFCFRHIPNDVQSQTYSTTNGGAWVIALS
jgi:hypothetical protein